MARLEAPLEAYPQLARGIAEIKVRAVLVEDNEPALADWVRIKYRSIVRPRVVSSASWASDVIPS